MATETMIAIKTQEAATAFITSAESRQLSYQTIRSYRGTLNPFTARFPSELPMRPEEIESFLASLEVGQETRYTRHTHLRIFYKWTFERYDVPPEIINPMNKIRPPRRRRLLIPSLTDDEINDALRATKTFRDYAMIRLFLDTGIRCGEAHNLMQEDVGEKSLKVSGKEGAEEVPISPEVRDMLRQLGPGAVFKGWHGKPLSEHGLNCAVRSILTRANVSTSKKGPHIFRHTFARVFLTLGGGEITLKNILRHATLTMTARYVNMWGSDVFALHQQYSPSKLVTVKPPDQRRGRGRPRKVSA